MLDFIRDLGKSAAEKRRETVSAYVDDALTPKQRQQFEQELAQDSALQAEVTQLQELKQNLRRLPRRSAPRNFTLDPAVYGAPQRQPLVQLYPAMRVATALTAVFFVIAVVADLLTFGAADMAAPAAEPVAMDVPMTRVTTEAEVEREAVEDTPVEEAAEAEIAVEEEAAEEEMAAEEAVAEEAVAETAITEEAIAEEAADEAMTEAAPPALEPGIGESMDTAGEVADGEDGAEVAEDAPAPTLAAAATPSPDTQSFQATEATGAAPPATEISAAPAPTVTDEADAETAVVLPPPPTPFSALRFFQVGLGILLLSLVLILVYTRRQM